VALAAAALLLAGCGGDTTNKGTLPIPAGGDDPSSTGTPGSTHTVEPTGPPRTVTPKAQVIVVRGSFAGNPAVEGFASTFPVYFKALVARDSKVVRSYFPGFFYADTAIGIDEAKRNGWVMRPPGSIVVVGVEQQPQGIVRLRTCRSQTTQYWNPKTRQWVIVAPKGAPDVYDMVKTGLGWMPYRQQQHIAKPYSCAKVHYPA
jgi:hypothetical protein